MSNKIILGTVQLGLDYGINNKSGKPSENQSFTILDAAWEKQITTLDSADAYGNAVETIGKYNSSRHHSFRIVNKFKDDNEPLEQKLSRTLKTLRTPSLWCYMYHQFSDWHSKKYSSTLLSLKEQGLISRIGVSLYSTDELAMVVNDPEIDIIQLPANLLDLDDKKVSILKAAKAAGKETHVRSIYLQGLFLKDPKELTGNLTALAPYLEKLRAISTERQIDLKKAALNFILQRDFIDYVVLGVDTAEQLKENLEAVDNDLRVDFFEGINVGRNERHLLNPSNWRI